MIVINKLTFEDIGRNVIYKPELENERGKIKSWNQRYIFVVYERPGRDMAIFENYQGIATDPEDLDFVK